MFADRARIHVEGGRGGDGALSFRREKYVPRGGPDGGDGGHGGDVALVADPDLRDLSSFHGRTHVRAGRGRHGRGANQRGADGETADLPVPVGTQVRDETDALVADLAHAGARAVVARGGRGGAGNRRFASATRQAPRVAEPGLPGEQAWIELHLKLLVDAALLGFPNAGKSSLLRRLSNATPKVADYPFTTLEPVLGTVEATDRRQLVVADVPGLLEGASRGVGLGDEFLAHLERARLLLHVLDASEPALEDRFRGIDSELRLYGAGLAERPQVVVLNKVDLLAAPPAFAIDDPRVRAVVGVSTVTGEGIAELERLLFELVPHTVEPHGPPELADFLVYRPRGPGRQAFRILRMERGYAVWAREPDRIGADELERALRAAGARDGDLVTFGDRTFELG